MHISELKSHRQVVDEDRRNDVEFRREWDRTAFSREVAVAVVRYRVDRGMSQRALAAATRITQPAIARLESGDHMPSLGTLVKLTSGTGLRFRVDVAGGAAELLAA